MSKENRMELDGRSALLDSCGSSEVRSDKERQKTCIVSKISMPDTGWRGWHGDGH